MQLARRGYDACGSSQLVGRRVSCCGFGGRGELPILQRKRLPEGSLLSDGRVVAYADSNSTERVALEEALRGARRKSGAMGSILSDRLGAGMGDLRTCSSTICVRVLGRVVTSLGWVMIVILLVVVLF